MKLTLTAEEGRKMVSAFIEVALSHGWEIDELEDANIIAEYGAAVDAAMAAIGITVEIDENENEDEDEDENENFDEDDFDDDADEGEEEDDDDSTTYSLTVKGEFVLRYMETGRSFEEACKVADLLFGNGE